MSIISSIYLYEAYLIQILQNLLPNSDGFFMALTKVADPAYAISIVFPVTASVNTSLAADVLIACVTSEWINTLLKWVLMEHRPYWWVKETGSRGIELRQTPLTCETGPGSPSGHIMGSAALLYVFLQFFVDYFFRNDLSLSKKQKNCRLFILWVFYFVLLVLVGMSRVIIGAHFPHQCLLGAVLGIMLGYLLTGTSGRYSIRNWWRSASRCKMLSVAAAISLISAGGYLFHFLVGADPHWSVRLAFKWCRNPEYVHVSTTPLFSLVRDSGAMIGLALASPVIHRSQVKFYPFVGVILVTLLVISMHLLIDFIPTGNFVAFYISQMSIFATLVFLLIAVVPYIAQLVKSTKEKVETLSSCEGGP
ncbi:glucose-6-Phosphatase [Lycorma delicatula]|uniref:glucose-6-Phosphatase n=1 Tax=Lycorma delicatula TaxID=130591 RepID=UPI003F51101A